MPSSCFYLNDYGFGHETCILDGIAKLMELSCYKHHYELIDQNCVNNENIHGYLQECIT